MISDMKAKLTILKMMRKNRFLLIDEEGMKILSFLLLPYGKLRGIRKFSFHPSVQTVQNQSEFMVVSRILVLC